VNVKPVALFCLFTALGLVACGSGDDGAGNPDSKLSTAEATAPIEGAPPELAAIREQGNQILDEGTEGYEQRLAELKAARTPVVVNKWASWCGPCRLEFPHFQSQAAKRGAEVAFLGVAANDSIPALETFLSELPLPYPSYYDPDMEISKELGGPTQAFPSTAYYDSSGELVFTQPGVYSDEADLAADIERYAH
jgi:cytochrome c biogenesis protein CcmG, thiol:disulfide interchange protein DsbE